jgi:hypothetical protein
MTNSHIRIELPLREKKEKTVLKKSLAGKRFLKKRVIAESSCNRPSIIDSIREISHK